MFVFIEEIEEEEVMGYDSSVVPLISAARWIYPRFGMRGLFGFAVAKAMLHPVEFTARVPGIRHSVRLRAKTTDTLLCEQVLRKHEYECDLSCPPKVIVDAGANIGLTSVYFANRYPDARIFAIEPESENFRLLRLNSARYKNIKPIRAALWGHDGVVGLTNPENEQWTFRVDPRRSDVPALTLDTLLSSENLDRIDLLKVDIEGAEKEVFSGNCAWVSRVGFAVIEFHDDFMPGCSQAVRTAMSNFRTWDKDPFTYFQATNSQ